GTIFHWAVFLFPPLWLVTSLISGNGQHTLWAGLLTALGISIRALSAAATHQRVFDALLLPVSVVAMTIIAGQSAYWYIRFGGPRWKGRTIVRRKRSLSNG
ncbi:MAG: hypothetical protein AAF125_11435, partial [Chloroflexota bacterium]